MRSTKFTAAQAAGIRAAVRPDPVQVIAVTGGKGGVGKTTTSVNLAASLAAAERRVLLIDMDPQGNAGSGLGVNTRDVQRGTYDVLLGRATLDEVVQGFLKFSRPEDLKLQPVSVSDLLHELVPTIAPEAEQRRVHIAVEAEGAPEVNGDPAMLGIALRSSGLDGLLDHVISVDPVRRYKTHPDAYALGPQTLGLEAKQIAFVSCNGWDALAATWYGFRTLWVNRYQLPFEELGTPPTRTGTSLRDVLSFF